MSDKMESFYQGWEQSQAKMMKEMPDLMKGFGGMFQTLMKEGALSVREKELVALGVGLAERCLPCMNLHVKKCLEAGATREQILEAAGVVVMMRGGPAFTHIPEIMEALDYVEGQA